MEKENMYRDDFAQGFSFYKLVWVFVLGSLIGTWYEEILTFLTKGIYENRSAVFIGPFNPLYGLAFVLVLLILYRFDSAVQAILVGALSMGLFEYGANFAQEFFTGSVSWNYESKPLDINGRTTIHYAFFWGFFSYVMVFHVYPPFSRLVEAVPHKLGTLVTRLVIVFLALNMVITYSALIRQGMRHENIEPFTPIGKLYDEVFTDTYIEKKFPNMEPIKEATND